MTHVTCRLTAKNRDQLRNPTLGDRVWATFTFFGWQQWGRSLRCMSGLSCVASPYSQTTYESCGESTSPVVVTSRSRRLWIYFKTDAVNAAAGFSIPYATYNGINQWLD